MFDPFALYIAGVTRCVLAFGNETMRQISRGKVDIRALAPLRAVGRQFIELVSEDSHGHTAESHSTRDMLIRYTTAITAYLDVLEDRDTDAADAKRDECDELAAQLSAAVVALLDSTGDAIDREPYILGLPFRRRKR